MPANTRDKVARSLIWGGVESAGIVLVSLVSMVVLARLLQPAEFGVAALAFVVVQVAEIFITMLSDALIQRKSLRTLDIDTAFWTSLGLGITGAVVCWAVAWPAAALYDAPELAPMILTLGFSCILSGADVVPQALLTRKLRIKALSMRTLASRLANTVITLLLAVSGFGAWSLVIGALCGSTIATLVLWARQARLPKLRFSRTSCRELVSFGLLRSAESVLWAMLTRVFLALVGWLHGLAPVGYCHLSFRLIDTVTTLLNTGSRHLALPLFSRLQSDPVALRQMFRTATRYTFLIAAPVFAGLIVVAGDFVTLVFGAKWSPAVPIVRIFAVASLVMFARLYTTVCYTAIGRPAINLVVALVGSAVTVAAVVASARAGLLGVALAWASRMAVTVPVGLYLLKRFLGLGYIDQFRDLAAPLLGCAVMMLALVIFDAIEAHAWYPLPRLLTSVVLGAVIYGGTVLLLDRQTVFQVAGLLLQSLGVRRQYLKG